MLLIQRLTPVLVCFLLLILRGMGADMEGCQKALKELFRATSSSLASFKDDEFGGPLLDYYFIPQSNIIDDLEFYLRNPVDSSHMFTNVIITNPVEFDTDGRFRKFFNMLRPDFYSVKFNIQEPHQTRKLGGSVKIVCKGSDCNDSLSRLKEHLYKPDKLICLKQRPNDNHDHFIKLKKDNKIEATIFGQSFDIIDTDLILQHLIRASTKQIRSFKATRILLNKEDKTVIFGNNSDKVVAQVPLPQPISSEALQYIKTAINVVNCEIKRIEYVDKKDSDHLKAMSLNKRSRSRQRKPQTSVLE